jgi:GMP synthase-like glutamine amidotransferase
MARILVISHEPEAAPAMIGELLEERGHDLRRHVVLADPERPDVGYPDPDQFAAVISFGSFASAYAASARAWVEPEIDLIRRLVDEEQPFLGICFGGQLLAESLGGHVERAPQEEHEVGLVTFDDDGALPFPAGPWFTWHEDRVVLPEGTDVLAHNGRAVQCFRHGVAVGTQFHPEADAALISSWVRIGPDHVPAHTTGERLVGEVDAHHAQLRQNCERLVDWFLADVAGIDA